MAFELHRHQGLPFIAASAINPGQAVKLNVGDVQRSVVPVGSGISANEPFAVAIATALQGEGVTLYDDGQIVKVTAGASLGHGVDVGVGSTNGALAPVSVASGSVIWSVGKSLTAAAAGEKFSLYVRKRQVSGSP